MSIEVRVHLLSHCFVVSNKMFHVQLCSQFVKNIISFFGFVLQNFSCLFSYFQY